MTFTFKTWNQQQKKMRASFEEPGRHAEALAACLEQHGWTHESAVWPAPSPTFADQLWEGLREQTARRIPQNGDHSIAWAYWHLARIEDTALNLLVSASPMVLDEGGWEDKLKVSQRHTGNGTTQEEINELSAEIDLTALRSYRIAVGKRTQRMIRSLSPQRLAEKVSAEDIQRVRQQGAVLLPEGEGLLSYWGGRTILGLLLMPATRHNMVHLNEALSLKAKFT